MKIFKKKGITYSQYFLDLLNYRFLDYDNIGCSVECFNNCREQGYIIRIHSEETRFDLESGLTFYVYNHRISDEPTFTLETKESLDTLYSEDAWENRTYTFGTVEELFEAAYKIIKIHFKLGE